MINRFKNAADGVYEEMIKPALKAVIATGKEFGDRLFTFDRSKAFQAGSTQAQLKERDYAISGELLMALFGILAASFGVAQLMGGHAAFGSYALIGVGGLSAVVALKEAALHQIARNKEKKDAHITKETPEMTYSLSEFSLEFRHRLANQLHRIVDGVLGVKPPEKPKELHTSELKNRCLALSASSSFAPNWSLHIL